MPGRRRRILQIFSRYREYGGEEGSVYRIGDYLQRDNDLGTFIHSSDAFFGDLSSKVMAAAYAYHNPGVVKRLRRYQELGSYNVWLIHNVFPAMSPGVYSLAFRLGIPVVHYLHNYRFGCVNGFFLNHGEPCQRCMHGNFFPAMRTACWHESSIQSGIMGAITSRARGMDIFSKIAHWIAISEAQKREHVAMGIPEERITVIHHFYEPKGMDIPYPGNGHAVFIGRLSQEKGVDRLLSAWERIQHCGRQLWIVGEGPDRSRLERLAREKRLRNVRFTGFVESDQMNEIWRNAACSIVPSVWKEPFGMVVLEAWARGRPVVAHRIGALPEIITHDQDGLLVEPGHPQEMAHAILKLFENPDRAKSMGNAGKSRLERQFGVERWMGQMEAVFSAVLRPKGP